MATKVTGAHKKALAQGREQAAAIRRYLEAIEQQAAGRRRGRKRTPESIQSRLGAISEDMQDAAPLKRVQLIQERMDLEDELARLEEAQIDPTEFEGPFIKAVKPYSERKGIGYSAWRELGVPAAVLKKGGVNRS